jgi:hypothetical protein
MHADILFSCVIKGMEVILKIIWSIRPGQSTLLLTAISRDYLMKIKK